MQFFESRLHLSPRLVGKTVGMAIALTALAGCFGGSGGGSKHRPAVEVTNVVPVDGDISVANGTALEDVLKQLPASTRVTLANDEVIDVSINWKLSEQVAGSRSQSDFLMDQEWYPTARGNYEFTGTLELPSGVVAGDAETEIKALVALESGALLSVTEKDKFTQPGTYEEVTWNYTTPDGESVDRSFVYYVPASCDSGCPLMLTFHGAGSYGAGQLFYSGFDQLAEEEGFIVAAPDYGLSAKGTFMFPATEDMASDIIDFMVDEYGINEDRVYASGISMGGLASQTLAVKLGDRIAAVASVATALETLETATLPHPVSVVAFYGTEDSGDPDVFFAAGLNAADQIGADLNPVIEQNKWEATEEDPTSITRYTYSGGDNGSEVILYEITNGGHTWPGKYQYASLLTVGLTTQHFDATEVIWEHLSKHILP